MFPAPQKQLPKKVFSQRQLIQLWFRVTRHPELVGEHVMSIYGIAGNEGMRDARLGDRRSWRAAEARPCVAGLVSMPKDPEDHGTSGKENRWHRLGFG